MNLPKLGLVFSVAVVLCSGLAARGDLQFNANGKFKIMQLTDIHYDDSKPNNEHSLTVMADVLDAENPDMVVLTGDVVPRGQASIAKWETVLQVIQDRQIPWAVTLGNHDIEAMTAQQVISALIPMEGSLVQMGPTDIGGAGNYMLSIKDSTGQRDAAALYCLDTRDNGMTSAQIQWYRDQSAATTQANGGTPLPSLMFFHIPLPEYNDYWYPTQYNGRIGNWWENASPGIHTGEMFSAIESMNDVMGVFVGHNHGNDYALFYDNVCLAFGRKTGQNASVQWPLGGRVIELTEGQPGFDSWIREYEGGIVFPFHFQPVPEPSALVMLALGCAIWAVVVRRRCA